MRHVIESPNLKGIPHGFTTIKDPGETTSFFSFRGDNALGNVKILESEYSGYQLSLVKQSHSIDFVWTTKPTLGSIAPNADAQITSIEGILLGTIVADCAPVLIYCPSINLVAAVHAGWRGALNGIVDKVLKAITQKYSFNHCQTSLAVGPHLQTQSCEFKGQELELWKKQFPRSIEKRDEKYFVNISKKILHDCEINGVKDIWISSECTLENPNKFFSHRRDGEKAGRQIGYIGLP